MTRLLAVAVLSSLLAAAPVEAQTESTDPTGVLRVGKLYSYGGGTDLQHGFGMDLRYEFYPSASEDGYVGLVAQGQYELGDAWRVAGGLAAGWGIFGLEVGVSHRTQTSGFAASTGLQIAQSFTFGPVSIGGRLTIPLVDHQGRNPASPPGVQGIEGALVLRLAFGFTVNGSRRSGHACHGGGSSELFGGRSH